MTLSHRLTSDLTAIRADLVRAIRTDQQRHTRRRRATRITGAAAVGLAALSGTALGAGQLTGVIDLGGAVTAQPISSIPGPPAGAPGAPDRLGRNPLKLRYNYEVHGLTVDGKPFPGKVYLGSSQPLSSGHVCVGVNATSARSVVAGRPGAGPEQLAMRVQAPGGGRSPVVAPGSGSVSGSASGSGFGSGSGSTSSHSLSGSQSGSPPPPVGLNCK